jgi:hypothetical protein
LCAKAFYSKPKEPEVQRSEASGLFSVHLIDYRFSDTPFFSWCGTSKIFLSSKYFLLRWN